MPAIPLPSPPLGDGTIALREPRDTDVPAIVAACRDPDIPRYTLVPSPYDEDDARAYLATEQRWREDGTELGMVIVDAPDGELIGSIAARFDWDHDRASIGYWVARPARGRGVAPRAVRLLSAWLMAELRIARVEIRTHPANAASQRVASKAGFTREGVLRSYEEFKGERVDFVIYSLLPGDRVA